MLDYSYMQDDANDPTNTPLNNTNTMAETEAPADGVKRQFSRAEQPAGGSGSTPKDIRFSDTVLAAAGKVNAAYTRRHGLLEKVSRATGIAVDIDDQHPLAPLDEQQFPQLNRLAAEADPTDVRDLVSADSDLGRAVDSLDEGITAEAVAKQEEREVTQPWPVWLTPPGQPRPTENVSEGAQASGVLEEDGKNGLPVRGAVMPVRQGQRVASHRHATDSEAAEMGIEALADRYLDGRIPFEEPYMFYNGKVIVTDEEEHRRSGHGFDYNNYSVQGNVKDGFTLGFCQTQNLTEEELITYTNIVACALRPSHLAYSGPEGKRTNLLIVQQQGNHYLLGFNFINHKPYGIADGTGRPSNSVFYMKVANKDYPALERDYVQNPLLMNTLVWRSPLGRALRGKNRHGEVRVDRINETDRLLVVKLPENLLQHYVAAHTSIMGTPKIGEEEGYSKILSHAGSHIKENFQGAIDEAYKAVHKGKASGKSILYMD